MPNEQTAKTYEELRQRLNDAVEERKRLIEQQTIIDEKLDDIMRVIMATERSLRSLHPAIVKGKPPVGDVNAAVKAAVEEMAQAS